MKGQQRIPVVEEQVNVGKRAVLRGGVRINRRRLGTHDVRTGFENDVEAAVRVAAHFGDDAPGVVHDPDQGLVGPEIRRSGPFDRTDRLQDDVAGDPTGHCMCLHHHWMDGAVANAAGACPAPVRGTPIVCTDTLLPV